MKITGVAVQLDEPCRYSGERLFWMPKPFRHADILLCLHTYREITHPPIHGQGFVTEDGAFVDRIEAGRIALESGQVEKLTAPPRLYSEDLW